MNKRQKKKQYLNRLPKCYRAIETHCQWCGVYIKPWEDSWVKKYGCCCISCYAKLVGAENI
mgnify:CR=1 FL=1